MNNSRLLIINKKYNNNKLMDQDVDTLARTHVGSLPGRAKRLSAAPNHQHKKSPGKKKVSEILKK